MAPVFATLDDPLAVFGTFAKGLNNNGQIVGYYTDGSSHQHGFLYGDGTYTTIDNLATSSGNRLFSDTLLQDINDNGVIVGYSMIAGGFGPSGPQRFGTNGSFGPIQSNLPTPGPAFGTNNQNQVVGYYDGQFLPGSQSRNGYVIDASGNGTTLDFPNAQKTEAHAINNLGQIVGTWIGTDANLPGVVTTHGFFYNNGAYGFFDAPGGVNGTFAEGINNANLIVGYYVNGSGISHGYILNRPTGVYTTIDAPGATQTFLTGINDAGQIVGYYSDAGGHTHSFLYAEPPPPSNNDVWLLSNGRWSASVNPGLHPGNAVVAGSGDFNHNGTSDILWFNAANSDAEVWLLANGKWAGSVDIGTHPAGWQIAGAGDFNGDGTSDVLWFNPGNGQTDIWQLSNGHWAASLNPGSHPLGYQLAGIGDTNKDGTSDILWFNPTSGDVDEWKILNGKWAGSTDIGLHPGAGWQLAAVGDFNNDGTRDVFWFNPLNGQTDVWLLQNGKWSASVSPGAHPLGYTVVGAGDVNHDGTSDIVWFNPATGDVDEWLLANGKWAGSVGVGSHPGSGWLPALGDFNNDGTTDVFWHNTLM